MGTGITDQNLCAGLEVTEIAPDFWAWDCNLHTGRGAEGFVTRESAEQNAQCPGRDAPDYLERLALDES